MALSEFKFPSRLDLVEQAFRNLEYFNCSYMVEHSHKVMYSRYDGPLDKTERKLDA